MPPGGDPGALAAGLAALAVVPALGYLLFIRWLDRYDREPWSLVALAFFWGGTGGVVFGMAGTLTMAFPVIVVLGPVIGQQFSIVVAAPVTEEIAKLFIVLLLAFSRRFDGLVDGMVYGAASALGFAAVENFFYFLGGVKGGPEHLGALILIRTAYTMVGHGVATSLAGAAVGAAKFSTRGWLHRVVLVLAGLAVAILLHSLGNGMMILSQGAGVPVLALLTFASCFGVLVVAILLMQVELRREARTLEEELGAEAAAGTLPESLVPLVGSYRRRVTAMLKMFLTLRWGTMVRLQRFLRVATDLGMRRAQARARPRLGPDVEALRARLRELDLGGLA